MTHFENSNNYETIQDDETRDTFYSCSSVLEERGDLSGGLGVRNVSKAGDFGDSRGGSEGGGFPEDGDFDDNLGGSEAGRFSQDGGYSEWYVLGR